MKKKNEKQQNVKVDDTTASSITRQAVSIGGLLLPLGFKPNESVLSGVAKLLDECMDTDQLSSPIDIVKRRLQLDKLNIEEQLPSIMSAISGESSDLPGPIQDLISSLASILFATLAPDGRLVPAKKPSMGDIIKFASLIKKWRTKFSVSDKRTAVPSLNQRNRRLDPDLYDNTDYSLFN